MPDIIPNLSARQHQQALIASCDPALGSFLRAQTTREADQRLEYLRREFIAPLVTAILSRELRRGPSSSLSQLRVENETFRETQVIVEGSVATRLLQLRQAYILEQEYERPIANLAGYVKAAARHACADYLREKRPGRHALDTSLRAALQTSVDLAVWRQEIRMDVYEWRCGRKEWRDVQAPPIYLRGVQEVRAQLWQALKQESGTRAQTLCHLFQIVSAPLPYNDLLDFLAAFWDVEAPYRLAAAEIATLRLPAMAATVPDPESVVRRMGTLQQLWEVLGPLTPVQKAVVLLRLPQAEGGNYLEEFFRLGVASEQEIAEAVGLPLEDLRMYYPILPLEDADIALLLHIVPEDVRRIRQDARRRLERQGGREKVD